ncbi:tRNA (guanosine(37)-N1)-methyltransferase TrmD [Arenicella xantha]|uniref:tRNA (guanine-N(1)-)-methyltransferase n=1 Tax=Arenicella xantha TaxID=644221 RepID=A0A395JJN1_9GAMM|nr:tRNA (guanosine(37)-N1)-methyltransferase TrmD [Arenicella xantha]RBP49102.1 tRNA (guanine37-N(1)-) methyltransferase [Arenicella xantha]
MDCHVISIFPDMFRAISEHGVIGRAIGQSILSLTIHNPRDYADDKHNTVDARPFGGGPGMVMKPEPMSKVINAAKAAAGPEAKVIYLSPQGKQFDHAAAQDFASRQSLVLLAGRYEGIDERVLDSLVDEEWSIGDYVLSGGELPAMVMIDAVARLLPESLGNSASAQQDSFVKGLLDCPHYTKPREFGGKVVPDVLLSGDHQAIERWREQQALGRTWQRRPELLEELELTDEQVRLLDEYKRNLDGTSFEQ